MRNWYVAPSGRRPPVTCASRTLPMRNWYITCFLFSPPPLLLPFVGHYLWGIDTLSLKIESINFTSAFSCRTLPMRNWYLFPFFIVIDSKLSIVGHYLWGIDTRRYFNACLASVILCRTLPMRNWYPSGLIVSACACMLLSDITYEELIPAAVSWWPTTDSSRTLPMRNWYSLSTSYFISHYLLTD